MVEGKVLAPSVRSCREPAKVHPSASCGRTAWRHQDHALRWQEINRIAVFVVGPIQIAPLTPDFHVGFVDTNGTTVWFAEPAKPFFNQRGIGQNPTIDAAMINLEAALVEYWLHVAVAQRIAQVPGHRLNDQPRLELPALENVLRL